MHIKSDPGKIRQKLVLIPCVIVGFYLCISVILIWLSYVLAFESSANNFAGYILFFAWFGFFVWGCVQVYEHYKLYKLLSNSTIRFANQSIIFSNPKGEVEIQHSQVAAIEIYNSSKEVEGKSHNIQVFLKDSNEIKVVNSIKSDLPRRAFSHDNPFIILRDIYDMELSACILEDEGLRIKVKHYNDLALSRGIT